LVEDLFQESDHLASERSLLFWKLRSLMFHFSEREEYERCAVIRDLIWSLEIEFCL
jgi:protein-arginine kinase activator protein McsA